MPASVAIDQRRGANTSRHVFTAGASATAAGGAIFCSLISSDSASDEYSELVDAVSVGVAAG